jgi:amino acid transporter
MFDMERFNSKKIIWLKFNTDLQLWKICIIIIIIIIVVYYLDINRAWESIKREYNFSATESLGY